MSTQPPFSHLPIFNKASGGAQLAALEIDLDYDDARNANKGVINKMTAPIRPSLSSFFSSPPSRIARPSIRRFATSLQTLPSPSPYLPSYPDRAPSPIASSSAWTLDHPIWAAPTTSNRQNIVAALIFASDEDLVSALVASPKTPHPRKAEHADEWAASIDPGLAFLALRSRPTYDLFLQNLRPSLRKVYGRLQKSDNHQLLVSDLLLRHPDPSILRELLAINDDLPERRRLRQTLQLTILTRIGSSLHRFPPLSRSMSLGLAKTVLRDRTASIESISAVFSHLKATTSREEPEEIWTLFSLILHAFHTFRIAAIPIMRQLAEEGFVPSAFTMHSDPDHSSYPEIEVFGTMLRFALHHKLTLRAQAVTQELLTTVELSHLSYDAWDVIMESVRTVLAPKGMQDAAWAAGVITRLCQQRDWPAIPSATIERALEGIPGEERAAWYAGLRQGTYEPPSAGFLLYMLSTRPHSVLAKKILADLRTLSSEETAHVQADVLKTLLDRRRFHDAEKLFGRWGSTQLSFEDVKKVAGAAMERKPAFALVVLRSWETQRPTLRAEHRFKLAGLFLQLGDKSWARRQMAHLDPRDQQVTELVQTALDGEGMPKECREMMLQMGLVMKA